MADMPGKHDNSGLPDGTWMGGQYLGQGGDGTLHYWVKIDEDQKIVDRMVIKDIQSREDTQEPPAYRGIYEDLVRKGLDFGVAASGKAGEAQPDERFFREAYLQGLFTDPSGSSPVYTVPLRGYKKGHLPDDEKGTHWRVYMDLFHAGDLWNLVHHHTSVDDRGYTVDVPLPEAFIWWFFTCIANALVQMDNCIKTRNNARPEGDEVLVMIDMKPQNILLDAIRGNEYPIYPKPLMSDFGSAHITYKTDPKNVCPDEDSADKDPADKPINQIATVGYWAPEMSKWYGMQDIPQQGIKEPLHSWTNIWQAGRMIEALMRRKKIVQDDDWRDKYGQNESLIKQYPPQDPWFPEFKYSNELIEIVWRCQRFDPKLRPSPTELLAYIKQHAPNHTHGMERWANADWIAEQEVIHESMLDTNPEKAEGFSARMQARALAGQLLFLNEFPDQDLAERYANLDMDLPEGCLLAYHEITALPKTTTAITCALGLGNNSNTSFLRRAISAKRQRLIEGFPKTSCLEEWDSLHAMWLYEMMELPDPSDMTNDDWKLGPRTRGLNLPIVLKMTRRFYQSHPEATDPSAALSNDSLARYGTVSLAWMTWLIGETARRTVFLAHIVNYFASKDLETGEASPYYEPLNDEMIWNMPLPCSSAAWEAKTEQEWLGVVHFQHQVDDQAVSLSSIFALEPTIKSLLTKLRPEQLRLEYAGNLGLDNSDSLRNLVVHCALAEKF
ncbi:hypothetical protein KCU91_g8576, partial [Aureobasidium melanogenum]